MVSPRAPGSRTSPGRRRRGCPWRVRPGRPGGVPGEEALERRVVRPGRAGRRPRGLRPPPGPADPRGEGGPRPRPPAGVVARDGPHGIRGIHRGEHRRQPAPEVEVEGGRHRVDRLGQPPPVPVEQVARRVVAAADSDQPAQGVVGEGPGAVGEQGPRVVVQEAGAVDAVGRVVGPGQRVWNTIGTGYSWAAGKRRPSSLRSSF